MSFFTTWWKTASAKCWLFLKNILYSPLKTSACHNHSIKSFMLHLPWPFRRLAIPEKKTLQDLENCKENLWWAPCAQCWATNDSVPEDGKPFSSRLIRSFFVRVAALSSDLELTESSLSTFCELAVTHNALA